MGVGQISPVVKCRFFRKDRRARPVAGSFLPRFPHCRRNGQPPRAARPQKPRPGCGSSAHTLPQARNEPFFREPRISRQLLFAPPRQTLHRPRPPLIFPLFRTGGLARSRSDAFRGPRQSFSYTPHARSSARFSPSRTVQNSGKRPIFSPLPGGYSEFSLPIASEWLTRKA